MPARMTQRTAGARSASSVDLAIGARIRLARLERKMSQQLLAEKLGITFQQLQKYEKGVNRITASRLVELAAALDRPLAWFLESKADSSSANDTALRALSTAAGRKLFQAFAAIDDEGVRRQVAALVAAIADTQRSR